MLLIKPWPKPPAFDATEMKIIIITLNIWNDYKPEYISWNMEMYLSLLPKARRWLSRQPLAAAPRSPGAEGRRGPAAERRAPKSASQPSLG